MGQYKKISNMLKEQKDSTNYIETLNNIYLQNLFNKITTVLVVAFSLLLCIGYCFFIVHSFTNKSNKGIGIVVGITFILVIVFVLVIIFNALLIHDLSSDKVSKLNTFLATKSFNIKDIGINYYINNHCVYYSISLFSSANGMLGVYPLTNGVSEIPKVTFIFRRSSTSLSYTLDLVFIEEGTEIEEKNN